MVRFISPFLRMALFLVLFALVACSDDSSSSASSEGVARYTVIIYGQNGGDMEESIEATMKDVRDVIGDEKDIRVLVVYKYGLDGKDFDGTMAYPGQLLFFELTRDTDLSSMKDSAAIVKDSIKFYDPDYLASVINYAHDSLPAQEYLFFLEAHGEGFSFESDYPKSKRGSLAKQAVMSVMEDEWVTYGEYGYNESMTMEEFATGIKKSKIPHFKAILFHNCLMGNLESMQEIYPYADYVMVSEHSLMTSRGELMTEIVDILTHDENGKFEEIVKGAFENRDVQVAWKTEYLPGEQNGDFQFLKAEKLANLTPIVKRLSSRLVTLYADEKVRPSIDLAADKCYRVADIYYLYDIRDYARKLAEETKDDSLVKISADLDNAFDSMTLARMEAHFAKDAPLDHFSLSVVLVDSATYNSGMSFTKAKKRDSYELTTFHKESGWGNWLNVNAHAPKGNPTGQDLL